MQTKFVDIYGKAKFCYLNEPDKEFDPNGIYSVTLETTKEIGDPIVKAIEEAISKEVADGYKKNGTSSKSYLRGPKPYSIEGDKFIFKAKSKFKPSIWDKEQNALDKTIWKDTTMWVQCKLNPYNKSKKVGCTLYMSSVQVDKLVEGTATNGACPFPKREGAND